MGGLKEINAIKALYRLPRADFVSSHKKLSFAGNESNPQQRKFVWDYSPNFDGF